MLTELLQSSACLIIYKCIVFLKEKNKQISVKFGSQTMLILAFYILHVLQLPIPFVSVHYFPMHNTRKNKFVGNRLPVKFACQASAFMLLQFLFIHSPNVLQV